MMAGASAARVGPGSQAARARRAAATAVGSRDAVVRRRSRGANMPQGYVAGPPSALETRVDRHPGARAVCPTRNSRQAGCRTLRSVTLRLAPTDRPAA